MMNGLSPIQQQITRSPATRPKMTVDGIQIVREEDPQSEGWVFLDSGFDNENINPGVQSTKLSLPSGKHFLGKQTTKHAVTFIKQHMTLMNINPRNNRVEFISSNTGATVYAVTIPEGRYLTRTALMDALRDAMNTVTGASGLTFSYAVNPIVGGTPIIDDTSFNLAAAGGSFHFVLSSTHTCMNKGRFLYNLPRSQTLATNKNIGYVDGYYTRYIDFVSNILNEEQRVPATESGVRGGHDLLLRLFLPTIDVLDSESDNGDVPINHLRWVRKQRSKTISTIDIELYDEFGEILYLPQYDDDTTINSWYDLVMIAR